MLNLDALTEQAQKLPPLPATAAKVAELMVAPIPDLSAIALVAASDPALTAALLRRANSAAASANRSIGLVREAVTRLGAAAVLHEVTATAARPLLDQALPEYGIVAGQLWEHCRIAAIATELIAKHSRRRLPAEAATVALLHDIGKLVLARFLSAELRETLDRAFAATRSYRLAEREVLGVCQSELGGILAERWNLPRSIVLGIVHYHAPEEYEATLGAEEPILLLCHAVHLANFLAKCVSSEPLPKRDGGSPLERTASVAALGPELLSTLRFLGLEEQLPALVGSLELRMREHADA